MDMEIITWASLDSVVLIIFLVLFAFLFLLLKNKNKVKLPPGPIGLPVFGHFHLLGNNPHQDLYKLSQKHGPIMFLRFGFVPTIVVSSPSSAELVLKTHDLVFASRPYHGASKYIAYDQRNMLFSPYGTYWRNIRKLCTLELLSQTRINQFHSMRKSELNLLVTSLIKEADKRQIVDLSGRVSSLAADMSCLMVFGKKYDEAGYMNNKGFKAVVKETSEVAAKFNLADYFPYIGWFDLQGLNTHMKGLSKIFDFFLENIIDDHLVNKLGNGEARDFVDTLLAILESGEAGFEFDRRHIKAVLLDMFIASMDTSATAMEWALSDLIQHPLVMKKLQKELEDAVGMNHMVEESHLDGLKYLDCVIKESMRLHPVAPLLLPHESMEDCVLDGFHVPKGSRVIVNVWAIGRDPQVWSEPNKFLPERFIGSSIDVRGRDFQLLPFGSGRRGCPGLQLGLLVVKLVVAQFVHCFDWELPDGMLPAELDMSEHFGLVTARAKHLAAIPTYRLRI